MKVLKMVDANEPVEKIIKLSLKRVMSSFSLKKMIDYQLKTS